LVFPSDSRSAGFEAACLDTGLPDDGKVVGSGCRRHFAGGGLPDATVTMKTLALFLLAIATLRADPGPKIVEAARKQIGVTVSYDRKRPTEPLYPRRA
jgi:hypothetical protein